MMTIWMGMTMAVICLSPIWGTLGWILRDGMVRPRCVPDREIGAKAEELYAQYGERAFEAARAEEFRAWCNDDHFAQGCWKRVRKEIMRKEAGDGFTFKRIR